MKSKCRSSIFGFVWIVLRNKSITSLFTVIMYRSRVVIFLVLYNFYGYFYILSMYWRMWIRLIVKIIRT